jgi:hypothetical protein
VAFDQVIKEHGDSAGEEARQEVARHEPADGSVDPGADALGWRPVPLRDEIGEAPAPFWTFQQHEERQKADDDNLADDGGDASRDPERWRDGTR